MTDRRDKADAGSEEAGGWLLLIYRVPPEPTRLRSTVWRRIKSLGAIYLQNSVAARPSAPKTSRSVTFANQFRSLTRSTSFSSSSA